MGRAASWPLSASSRITGGPPRELPLPDGPPGCRQSSPTPHPQGQAPSLFFFFFTFASPEPKARMLTFSRLTRPFPCYCLCGELDRSMGLTLRLLPAAYLRPGEMKVTHDHTAKRWRWALNRGQTLSSVCFGLGFPPEHTGSMAQGACQAGRSLGSPPRLLEPASGVGAVGEQGPKGRWLCQSLPVLPVAGPSSFPSCTQASLPL